VKKFLNKCLQMKYMIGQMTLRPGVTVLNLSKVLVQPVRPLEEQCFQQLMQEHHYLGALPKISETLYLYTFSARSR